MTSFPSELSKHKDVIKTRLETFLTFPLGFCHELNTDTGITRGLCYYLTNNLRISETEVRSMYKWSMATMDTIFPRKLGYLPFAGSVTPERQKLAKALLEQLCTPTE